jgi:RNA polymerase sigma-70 factor (ECF subfamily)
MFRHDIRSDESLIDAMNHGDTRAFEVLYYRYRDWVYRLARRFTGDDEEALDVLQETFTYFLRKFPGFTLTAKLTTFLYPAIKNRAMDRIRIKKRYVSGEKIFETIGKPPDTRPRSLEDLASLLECLPPGQYEVLIMRFVDEMKLDEIAAALNIPLGTVKSRLHNALKTLKTDERTRAYFEKNTEHTAESNG